MTYRFEHADDPQGFVAHQDRVNARLVCGLCGDVWTWSVSRNILDLLPDLLRDVASEIMDEHGKAAHP